MPTEHPKAERKIRVCCFCERWESGGIESFLCNVLTHMDLSRLEVDIVASQIAGSVFTAPLKACGVGFYELSGRQNDIYRNQGAFRKLLMERQYDVIHLNVFQGLSLYYARLAKNVGVPVRIAHSHNTDLRKSPARWIKRGLHAWGKWRYGRDCTDLWACSESAAKFLFTKKDLLHRGYQFIPNGIETERFRFDPDVREQVRAELGLTNQFVIGNVGRLCEQKNQSFLLDVFREVVSQKPNSRLLLVGEGEDLSLLKEKANRLGIAEKVIFHGVTDHVERLLWAMDVFVLPSKFEGLPVTAIEAQAAGLSCLFSDIVTKECQVEQKTCFLSLDSPTWQWTEHILSLCNGENRDDSADAVRAFGFDISKIAEQIENFYIKADAHGRP